MTASVMNDVVCAVRELRHVVCTAASSFDPAGLDGASATDAAAEWAAIAHAADAAMALAAARLAACDLPVAAGARRRGRNHRQDDRGHCR